MTKETNRIYQRIEEAQNELASHYGLLVISKATAKANVFSFAVEQKIIGSDLYLGESGFAESYSESRFYTTSDRFYDEGKGTVKTYSSPNSAFLKSHAQEIPYDDFIRKYGKIMTKKKYFTRIHPVNKQDLVQEAYIAPEEGNSGKTVYGFLNVAFPEGSIKSFREEGNDLYLTLDTDYSHTYFRTQMRAVGRLEGYPQMKSSEYVLRFDEEGHLREVDSLDKYTAKTGFLSSPIEMAMKTFFYPSENDVFLLNGEEKKLSFPKIGEPFDVYGKEEED